MRHSILFTVVLAFVIAGCGDDDGGVNNSNSNNVNSNENTNENTNENSNQNSNSNNNNATNDPPTITSLPATEQGQWGDSDSFTVVATDPNPGDTLSYAVSAEDCSFMPTIDAQGLVTWTCGDVESCGVEVTVSDDGVPTLSATGLLTIDCLNSVPVFESTPLDAVDEQSLYSYAVTCTDPEGDSLILATGASHTCDGTLVDHGDGTADYSFYADETMGGTSCTVHLTCDDTQSLQSQTTGVSVAEVNAPPTLQPISGGSGYPGSVFSTAVTCTDPDADSLVLYVSAADTCGGTVTDHGDGTGTYTFTHGLGAEGTLCTAGVACEDPVATDTQAAGVYTFFSWSSGSSLRLQFHPMVVDAALQSVLNDLTGYFGERLAVARLTSNLVVSTSTCGAITVPSAHRASGVADTDTIVYVTMDNTANCVSSPNTKAYGMVCEMQAATARPLVGVINVCPNAFEADRGASLWLDTWHSVIAHETLHVLGFAGFMFPNFAGGDPRITVNERGNNAVTKIASTAAVQAAREYTGCATLQGVELEDGGAAGMAGNHLEGRLYHGALMAGRLCDDPPCPLTAITLAILEDSGWYSANWNKAEPLLRIRELGCDVAHVQRCDQWPGGTDWMFCASGYSGCTPERTHVGSGCSTAYYGSPLPVYNQYFTGEPTRGGIYPLQDYCPVISPVPTMRCRDALNVPLDAAEYGSIYGTGSKCLSSTLWDSSQPVNPGHLNAGCYAIENCSYTGLDVSTYDIRVPAPQGGADLVATCTFSGEQVSFTDYDGVITCAPPREVCPALY